MSSSSTPTENGRPRVSNNEGPALEPLLQHLRDCPSIFLHPLTMMGTGYPKTKKRRVALPAMVFDLLSDLGDPPDAAQVEPFSLRRKGDIPAGKLVAVATWLLCHEAFAVHPAASQKALDFLMTLREGRRGHLVAAKLFVRDDDRREELVRLALAAFGWRPQGEREAFAQDRLTTLDTLEQSRILAATRAAHERAKKVREAMQRKAAQQAAAKVSRE